MFDFAALKIAEKKSQESSSKNKEKYEDLFIDALDYLDKFNNSKNYNKDVLEQASEKLLECVNQKSNDVRCYVFLAYISFVLDDIKLTHKYLSIAYSVDPDSELLKRFKEKIGSMPLHLKK